ncbi:sodium:alanine symporter family protein [Heyndrickxia camelliae]|uniref:Sodium:alanine symporter family protein n=2 Tax=Heyndrickxia camelliae TaxID=1707093 RepID=A0A2N3LEK6_9BACI|nr:sodium:alanine symporter family protein [Heyndrickxia camelliae]PKR83015.1 sodium:alanine symporter family protein [Heyndrickxia camelliae]
MEYIVKIANIPIKRGGLVKWLEELISKTSDIVWGPAMLVLLVGTGIFLSFRLGFLQFSNLPYALKLAFTRSQDKKSSGDISHFQSLMTALAATIGTGNIAGVSTAVIAGGPGAVFWMWVTAIFGMATKYGEAILSVKYRVKNSKGEMSGGPMYYIERGLGWKWLAVLFAIFGAVASFGIGNLVQSNSVAEALNGSFGISPWITGIVLAVFTGLVILGGIKSIGRVTGFIVPFMAIFYVLGGLIIILLNIKEIPHALGLIFGEAFTAKSVGGGVLGTAVRYGVARGVFSNEAGLGSAPIAAAAAKTDYPGRQALVSMTGTFLDTIVVCSITGLTLVMSGKWVGADTDQSSSLTVAAFNGFLPHVGGYIVTFGLIFFAYSTVIGWSYYGEKCVGYLLGDRSVYVYRVIFTLAVLVGSVSSLKIVWGISDVFNALMAIPNLIALLLLSRVIVAETKIFKDVRRKEKIHGTAKDVTINT